MTLPAFDSNPCRPQRTGPRRPLPLGQLANYNGGKTWGVARRGPGVPEYQAVPELAPDRLPPTTYLRRDTHDNPGSRPVSDRPRRPEPTVTRPVVHPDRLKETWVSPVSRVHFLRTGLRTNPNATTARRHPKQESSRSSGHRSIPSHRHAHNPARDHSPHGPGGGGRAPRRLDVYEAAVGVLSWTTNRRRHVPADSLRTSDLRGIQPSEAQTKKE